MAPHTQTPIGEIILWFIAFALGWFLKWKYPRGIRTADAEKRKRAEELAARLARTDKEDEQR